MILWNFACPHGILSLADKLCEQNVGPDVGQSCLTIL